MIQVGRPEDVAPPTKSEVSLSWRQALSHLMARLAQCFWIILEVWRDIEGTEGTGVGEVIPECREPGMASASLHGRIHGVSGNHFSYPSSLGSLDQPKKQPKQAKKTSAPYSEQKAKKWE